MLILLYRFGSCSLKKFDFNILGIDFLLFFPLVLNFKLDLYYLTSTKRFANYIYIEECKKYKKKKKFENIYIGVAIRIMTQWVDMNMTRFFVS